MRRAAALWLVLFAAYAATLGLPAFGASRYDPDEAHYLLIAKSIVDDGDVDLTDQYAARAYSGFYPYALDRRGELTNGQADEPGGLGFPLLIAPAYALGGAVAVQLLMAAIAALAFVLAAALARRIAPEPWASGAALACGLSPPALAYGTAVLPQLTAGAVLTGAALLALRARERPRIRWVLASATAIGVLPWLDTWNLVPALVVAAALVHWLRRRDRSFAILVSIEAMLFSGIVFVAVNERLYGGPTPLSAGLAGQPATGASFPDGYLHRAYRLVALWLDRDYGALRWAPVLVLAFFAVWLLWRSRRDRLARAVPERRDVEAAAELCVLVCGAQVVVAAFLAPTMFGFWFPGRELLPAFGFAAALCAWGMRHLARAGIALAAVTVASSAWLYAQLRIDGGNLIQPPAVVPFGPLRDALPRFGTASPAGSIAVVAVLVALLALAAREVLARRRLQL